MPTLADLMMGKCPQGEGVVQLTWPSVIYIFNQIVPKKILGASIAHKTAV